MKLRPGASVVLVLALLGVCAARAAGARVTLQASVANPSIPADEATVYVLNVTARRGEPPPLDIEPDFTGLTARSQGPPRRIRDLNTGMVTDQYLWTIVPHREGVWLIPPVVMHVDDVEVRSNAVQLNVMPDVLHDYLHGRQLAPPVSARPARHSPQHAELFKNRLYLLVCADNASPYCGQQVNLSLYLVNKGWSGGYFQISEPELDDEIKFTPDIPGFPLWVQRPAQMGFFGEVRLLERADYRSVDSSDGRPIMIRLLKRIALFPTVSGRILLGHYRAHAYYEVQRMGEAELYLETAPLYLEVKPLPTQGRPAEFSGAIGDQYKLTASLTPSQIARDEVATLSVTISGLGLPSFVKPPRIPESDLFEVYSTPQPPEPEDFLRGDRRGGKRRFEYLLRFKKTGDLELPPLEYTVFNPVKERYETLRSDPLRIHVSPAPSTPLVEITQGSQGQNAQGAQAPQLASDVLNDIVTTGFVGVTASPISAYTHPLVWFLHALPVFFLAAAFAYRRHRERLISDRAYAYRLRARGQASRRLRRAQRALRQGEAEVFHAELAAAMMGYLAEKLGCETTGMTWESIDSTLAERGVDRAVRQSVGEILHRCDFARFAPETGQAQAMADLLESAGEAMRNLDRQLAARRGRKQ